MGQANSMLFFFVILIFAVQSRVADAESDVFMCIDGIEGSSNVEQFAGCSEIFGVSYSAGSEGSRLNGGGGRASRPVCGDYVVSKPIDAASIPLLTTALTGRILPTVEFALRNLSGFVVFQIELERVIVRKVQQNLNATAEAPVEEIVLEPREMRWTFTEQDETGAGAGTVDGGFDCARNVPR